MTLAHSHEFNAIGTKWRIDTESPLSYQLQDIIDTEIADFDRLFSRFRADSIVSKLHTAPLPTSYTFPPYVIPLFELYEALYDITNHKVSLLTGASLEVLGYDADYSLTQHTTALPAPDTSVLTRNDSSLTLLSPALIDIGAAGKGLLIDRIASLIGKYHRSFVIDGSGDILVNTDFPEIIGLEDPNDSTRIIGTVSISRGALCGSATNRRSWGKNLHHIIDATSGKPTTDIIATWAYAPSAMVADGLSTGLFFAEPNALHAIEPALQFAVLAADGSIQYNLKKIGDIYE